MNIVQPVNTCKLPFPWPYTGDNISGYFIGLLTGHPAYHSSDSLLWVDTKACICAHLCSLLC